MKGRKSQIKQIIIKGPRKRYVVDLGDIKNIINHIHIKYKNVQRNMVCLTLLLPKSLLLLPPKFFLISFKSILS